LQFLNNSIDSTIPCTWNGFFPGAIYVDICLLQESRARISHPVIALLEPMAFVARQICNLCFALENVLGTFKIIQNDVF
jgi:hypothetical protein